MSTNASHGDRRPNEARAALSVFLHDAMARAGLSVTEVARTSGLGRTTIHNALNPSKPAPRTTTVTELAKVLNDQSGRALALRNAAKGPAGGMPELGKPVEEWDPVDLGIHPAVETSPAPDVDQQPNARTLPRYVPRAHDAKLIDLVDAVRDGRSAMAVLVGAPSTGKSRACWEALQPLASGGWRLWHAVGPSRPEALLGGLERIGPCTVVWVDDMQTHLRSPDGDLGENVASALEELLRDPRRTPVLVLGTIRKEDRDELCSPAVPGRRDPHAKARGLLVRHGIDVPDAFVGEDLETLVVAAETDPLLRQAHDLAENGRITQYIAGIPALMERYRTCPAAERALIHAAIELRTHGLGPALPKRLLEATAAAYLTESQWQVCHEPGPTNWPDSFLDATSRPLLGIRGPLERIHARPWDIALGEPHYSLNDHLWQSARDLRAPFADGSEGFARAILVHATPAEIATVAHTTTDQADYYRTLHQEGNRVEDAAAWLIARMGADWSLRSIHIVSQLKRIGAI